MHCARGRIAKACVDFLAVIFRRTALTCCNLYSSTVPLFINDLILDGCEGNLNGDGLQRWQLFIATGWFRRRSNWVYAGLPDNSKRL
jgi:hypothetical protein